MFAALICWSIVDYVLLTSICILLIVSALSRTPARCNFKLHHHRTYFYQTKSRDLRPPMTPLIYKTNVVSMYSRNTCKIRPMHSPTKNTLAHALIFLATKTFCLYHQQFPSVASATHAIAAAASQAAAHARINRIHASR